MARRGKQGAGRERLRTGQVTPEGGGTTGGGEFPGIPDLGAPPPPPTGGGGLPAINITNIATATAIAINESGPGNASSGPVDAAPGGGSGGMGGSRMDPRGMMMDEPGMMSTPQMASPGQPGIVGMNPPGMMMNPPQMMRYRF